MSIETLPAIAGKLNNSYKPLAIRESKGYQADYVHHLTLEEVRTIASTLGERDRLLVEMIFDGCLRVSEALGIRPEDIILTSAGWQLRVLGKGSKRSVVAISASIAAQLQAFAYRKGIAPADRLFTINRTRVHQIVKGAMAAAGIAKPDGVGTVHVLRHSGAIERLKRTGNPKAVQDQLRHKSAQMTLRYMKTLSHEESLKIQGSIDLQW